MWDTAGQERFRTITQSYYRNAHAVIITYDITKKDSFKNVTRWTEDVKKYAPPNVLKLLVGNKTDINDNREVSLEDARSCAAHYSMVDVLEASAKVLNLLQKEIILGLKFIGPITNLPVSYPLGYACILERKAKFNSFTCNLSSDVLHEPCAWK